MRPVAVWEAMRIESGGKSANSPLYQRWPARERSENIISKTVVAAGSARAGSALVENSHHA